MAYLIPSPAYFIVNFLPPPHLRAYSNTPLILLSTPPPPRRRLFIFRKFDLLETYSVSVQLKSQPQN